MGIPLTFAVDVVRTTALSLVDQRRELLNREERSLGVQVEHLVEGRLGRVLERGEEAEPGVDEEQIEGLELGLHPRGEGVDIRQRASVARNRDPALPKLFLR